MKRMKNVGKLGLFGTFSVCENPSRIAPFFQAKSAIFDKTNK